MGAGTIQTIESLQVETTSRCNLSCQTCLKPPYRSVWQEEDLSMDLFSSIVEQLSASKPNVHLQGWGEPLIQNNFIAYIKRLKKEDISTSFTTNGTIMSQDLACDLIASGLDGITFSLAGATSNTHDGLRGAGSFAKVVEAIGILVAAKVQLQKEAPKVAVSYLLTNQTLKELPRAVAMCRKMAVDAFVTVYLTQAGSTAQRTIQLLPEKSDSNSYWFTKMKAHCAGLPGKMYLGLRPFSSCLAPVCDKNPVNSSFISSNGKVSPCVFLAPPVKGTMTWFEKNGAHKQENTLMGDLKKTSLKDIWNSERYVRFRELYQKRKEYHDHQLSNISYTFAGAAELEKAVKKIKKYFRYHPAPDECRYCAKLKGY